MAQTIAVQRGSTTVTTDGATKTTLFTQSSGVATRVIVGGMTGAFPAENSQTRYMVFINVNGSGNYIPVIIRAHGNSSTRYITTFPNSDSAIGTSLSGKIADATGQSSGISIGSNLAAGWATSINGNNMNAQVFQQNIDFNQTPLNISPGNFWIANGDSLVVAAWQSGGSGTTTINYHFVTVTET